MRRIRPGNGSAEPTDPEEPAGPGEPIVYETGCPICGRKHVGNFFERVPGVDISPAQIEMAGLLSQGMHIQYIVSPIEKLNLPKDSSLYSVCRAENHCMRLQVFFG